MKSEFSPQIFEKYSIAKFHKNLSSDRRAVQCERAGGQTDTKKLILAFRNFANAPKNGRERQNRPVKRNK
jgi:hypothetical protein